VYQEEGFKYMSAAAQSRASPKRGRNLPAHGKKNLSHSTTDFRLLWAVFLNSLVTIVLVKHRGSFWRHFWRNPPTSCYPCPAGVKGPRFPNDASHAEDAVFSISQRSHEGCACITSLVNLLSAFVDEKVGGIFFTERFPSQM
jgi:hypothetical protein